MPELPEVEVLARYLRPRVTGRRIVRAEVRRARVVRPLSPRQFARAVAGCTISKLGRRGKYLVFTLERAGKTRTLLGHLGMSGRMDVLRPAAPLPVHTSVVLQFEEEKLVFVDTRYFGRFILGKAPIEALGPEPLTQAFTPARLAEAVRRSKRPIKTQLLDQLVVAGVGNIYASEALHRAKISPAAPGHGLTVDETRRLYRALRAVLQEAITSGSTVAIAAGPTRRKLRGCPSGTRRPSGGGYESRLRVYDRAGQPCPTCQSLIKRIFLGARSTFFCPKCQP